jgi:hypothetical protein
MKLELNATVLEDQEPRRMTLWFGVEGKSVGSNPVLNVVMDDGETDEAAALRAVELLFSDAEYDLGGDIDDLRRELQNHEHGRMT